MLSRDEEVDELLGRVGVALVTNELEMIEGMVTVLCPVVGTLAELIQRQCDCGWVCCKS